MAHQKRNADPDIVQPTEPATISRDLLAAMVASHTSGLWNAVPEQDDFDRADEMIALLNQKIAEY